MDFQLQNDTGRRTAKWTSICIRSLEVWLLISTAEVIHGVVRITFLQPLVGDFRARQVAVFSGSALILAVGFLFRHWIDANGFRENLAVGAIWVMLTIGFEILLGRLFMDLSWERILSDYDVPHGGLMPIGLTVMLFAPLLVSLSGRNSSSSSNW